MARRRRRRGRRSRRRRRRRICPWGHGVNISDD